MSYQFRGMYIPDRMMDGITRYIEHGVPPGDFLTAIIRNDLGAACQLADDENLANIPAFVAYFYFEAPGRCWGSVERMNEWVISHPSALAKAQSWGIISLTPLTMVRDSSTIGL